MTNSIHHTFTDSVLWGAALLLSLSGCATLPEPLSGPGPGADATIHYRHDGELAQCDAILACRDACEVLVLPETCSAPWGLEPCLTASVAVPGGDAADVLGCDPWGRIADIDWTPIEGIQP